MRSRGDVAGGMPLLPEVGDDTSVCNEITYTYNDRDNPLTSRQVHEGVTVGYSRIDASLCADDNVI